MKMHMFKATTLAGLMLVMIVSVSETGIAQRIRMSVDERIKSLTEQLSLTKLQADSARKIYQHADSLRTNLFEARRGDRTGMRDLVRTIQDSADAKIELLLTKEQKEKFVTIRKQRPQRPAPLPESKPDRE